MSQVIQGQIRAILAFVGGIAVSRGWIDSETATLITGAAVAVFAAYWSWASKKKNVVG